MTPKEMAYEIEMYYASQCRKKQIVAQKAEKTYECTCPDPYKMSDEELVELYNKLFENNPNDLDKPVDPGVR